LADTPSARLRERLAYSGRLVRRFGGGGAKLVRRRRRGQQAGSDRDAEEGRAAKRPDDTVRRVWRLRALPLGVGRDVA